MRKRISRIAPLQLGKVSAVFYGIFSIPIAAIMAVMAMYAPSGKGMSIGFAIAIPVFYIVFGFVMMVIAAWLYNVIAGWTGGIEFESVEVTDA